MTTPNYSVREAEARDAPELARLCGELGYPARAQVLAARLAALQARGDLGVMVASGNVGLWGWIAVERSLSLVADEHAEITALVVDASARECGIGRALVDSAEDWARSRALGRIVVRSNSLRPASHVFYQKLGYTRLKTQHVYDRHLERTQLA